MCSRGKVEFLCSQVKIERANRAVACAFPTVRQLLQATPQAHLSVVALRGWLGLDEQCTPIPQMAM